MTIVIKHEQDCHSRGDEWDRTGWKRIRTEIIRMRLFEKISFMNVKQEQVISAINSHALYFPVHSN